MRRHLFQARFHETYYFANIVRNILADPQSYMRRLDDFYGDDKFLNFIDPFPRFSSLHMFIEEVVREILHDDNMNEDDLMERQESEKRFAGYSHLIPKELHPSAGRLPVEHACEFYGIECTSFRNWLADHGKKFQDATPDDAYDYFSDLALEGPLDDLVEQAVSEVFFVVFQNRGLLRDFNVMMAGVIGRSSLEEVPEEKKYPFRKEGVLKRVAIPVWVQRAVFHRDRALCVLCHRDLSGIISVGNIENYDHIVPLAEGGLNDVSNIQLLCAECNSKKKHHRIETSESYEVWYPMND